MRAVVFAYHDVGARCLQTLLAHGVEVALVFTHEDDPGENVWFQNVKSLASLYDLPVCVAEDPNQPEVVDRVRSLAPDFLFSFYYRRMLSDAMLGAARRGAFNLHGSLLPKYRGRAPVNWAVLHGEAETGATLHEMEAKPDAGPIVGQQRVPILPNDLAVDVFRKVTVAAEQVLQHCLPDLLAGRARRVPQDAAQASYFGRRRPEDGRIDWSRDAWSVHNLVRAVAPPYPGAFGQVQGHELRVLRTFYTGRTGHAQVSPCLAFEGDRLLLHCADRGGLYVLNAELDGEKLDRAAFERAFGPRAVLVEDKEIHH